VATAVAVEVTLLHNFAGMYGTPGAIGPRKASVESVREVPICPTAVVSMAGNLALMPLLVDDARMPVIGANAVACWCAPCLNFLLGDGWVFKGRP